MATLASLTGVAAPSDRELDSIDLSETVLNATPSPRDEWFYYARRGNLWAARVGSHKLVLESWDSVGKEGELLWRGFDNHQIHDPPMLFDLSTDLGERLDIASERPQTVAEIHGAIQRHRADLSATH